MSPQLQANLLSKLDAMAAEHAEIEHRLADPDLAATPDRLRELSVKHAALRDVVERHHQHRALTRQIAEAEQLAADASDPEMAALAKDELPSLRAQADATIEAIANDLVTADDRQVGSVILEVRAGTGGAEAMLFAGELLGMYTRYAAKHGWSLTTLELSSGEQGGVRHAIANVRGQGVWQGLGYESGVHCVKRVPETETQGRIHTSTATVAVLPEPQKVQIDIPESDVKMDITTAQGPGGQNVNKVATAVKMVHIPTGIEVRMQESKSQQQNRERAWTLMRARVYDHYQRIKHAERDKARNQLIGSGDRGERIRTYRWKESIVVDHRLNESYPLPTIIAGDLDALVHGMIAQDRAQRLAAL